MKVNKLILVSILLSGGLITQAKEIPNLAAEVKSRLEISEAIANSWLQSLHGQPFLLYRPCSNHT